jgi:hypothetical protein
VCVDNGLCGVLDVLNGCAAGVEAAGDDGEGAFEFWAVDGEDLVGGRLVMWLGARMGECY